jgi:hypothetical protein
MVVNDRKQSTSGSGGAGLRIIWSFEVSAKSTCFADIAYVTHCVMQFQTLNGAVSSSIELLLGLTIASSIDASTEDDAR